MFTINTKSPLPDSLPFAKTQYKHSYFPSLFPYHISYIQLEVQVLFSKYFERKWIDLRSEAGT